MSVQESIVKQYGNRLRIRVCGFLEEEGEILLLNHSNLGSTDFWIPPGGGMEFGESASETLVREFKEETGLEIEVQEFLCVNEFLKPPLHGIELFFRVKKNSGKLLLGSDPEMEQQLIKQIHFFSFEELNSVPTESLHPIVKLVALSGSLLTLKGYHLNGIS